MEVGRWMKKHRLRGQHFIRVTQINLTSHEMVAFRLNLPSVAAARPLSGEIHKCLLVMSHLTDT